ncbi:imidazolonepropionase-like domain-containing protein [Streptomyces olivochromogenes]|uniref:Aminodeoxyfutalosine deaminase/Imidazolonepropionase-like composite domain-containing protein n=1 Tax=Streptomyces olivochromogenes TaxID=1963 RepID=A0A250VEE9_STROL|nr:hypothetical protein [Streptomyces olivochromogenes]KUN46719.1 hypothetical protein AQJ27_14605 [Streptomyces olivochromogenes]GAX52489.1 hypothetical protein SO3561_04005 [Streptomyces olivochromogenes]
MLTIHTADELRISWDADPLKDGAVAVEGDRVAGTGPLDVLLERFPGARVRSWPGVLGPALVHEGPLPQAPSPRERVHAILKSGAVAVLQEHVDTPELRAAAQRNDVVVLARTRPTAIVAPGRADLAVFDVDGACVATVCAGRLVHRRR